jgi:hypothetical protein
MPNRRIIIMSVEFGGMSQFPGNIIVMSNGKVVPVLH